MAKISILVPICNVEKYLFTCLNSLKKQSFSDIEIICVNDGSTDNSLEIINRFASDDPRFIVIDKKNTGYGNSMNIALKKASGEYIGIVESDDFVEECMFEKLYNTIILHDCDFVKADFYDYYTSKDRAIKQNFYNGFDTNKKMRLSDNYNALNISPTIWSALYKKSFLEKNNIVFTETPGASFQDLGFTLKVFLCADSYVFIEDALLYYRKDNMNSSMNSNKKVYCVVDEFNDLFNYIETNKKLLVFKEYVIASQFLKYRWNLNRLSFRAYLEFYKFFWNTFSDYHKKGILTEKIFNQLKKYHLSFFINHPVLFFIKNIIKHIIEFKFNNSLIYIKVFDYVLINRELQ